MCSDPCSSFTLLTLLVGMSIDYISRCLPYPDRRTNQLNEQLEFDHQIDLIAWQNPDRNQPTTVDWLFGQARFLVFV